MNSTDGFDEERLEIRVALRQAARRTEGLLTPSALAKLVEFDFGEIVATYGCLAEAACQAGVSYLNPEREPEPFAAETDDRQLREQAVTRVHALSKGFNDVPAIEETLPHIRMSTPHVHRAFGSWQAVLREAGIDPSRDDDRRTVTECCQAIRRAAIELEAIPSARFVEDRTGFPAAAWSTWFEDWATAVEAAIGTSPDEIDLLGAVFADEPELRDLRAASRRAHELVLAATQLSRTSELPAPKTELRFVIEVLAEQLDHRPSAEEVLEYLPYQKRTWRRVFGSVAAAIDAADVPNERDLTPTGSLNRQPMVTGRDEVPSHMDLLRDLRIVHTRGPSSIEADFNDRGVVDKRHYTIQFGSFEAAVEFYRSLDARHYREPREANSTLFLGSAIDELTDLLGRPPLLEEFAAMSEYSLEEILDLQELDPDHHRFLAETTWSNADLLDDLIAVGEAVGQPPTTTDYRELGDYPVECYLRRFNSWPGALAAVGVEVTADIPDEYLAIDLTRDTWRRTDRLVKVEFGHTPALKDDLARHVAEFGGQPTREAYRTWGGYPVETVDRHGDWETTLAWAGIEGEAEPDEYAIDRDGIETTLASLGDGLPRELLPADVALFTPYSVQTIVTEYGSLEAACSAAGVSTAHLAVPVTSVTDAWDDRHWDLATLLAHLRELADSLDHPLRYRDVREADGVSTSTIYRYFRTYDEAKRAAGLGDGTEDAGATTRREGATAGTLDPEGSILGQVAQEFDD